ncbi:MAG: phage tail protein [Lachnospiraceae bacterium]|jgi:hypothetical protein|nr:phage tail protein [Lachnospiraceae bacterium]
MYQVLLDGRLLYNPTIQELLLTKARLSLELNTVGWFDFTLWRSHPYYNAIFKMKSIVEVYEDSDLLFKGRVLNTQDDLKGFRAVECEGELSFLNDSHQRPFAFGGTPEELFTQFIDQHNALVDASKHFIVGNVTVTDPNDYINRSSSDYLSTMEAISTRLIDTLGGYLWVRHESDGTYIDYLDDFTVINQQSIVFAKNLLEFEDVIKGQDVATAVIPLGAQLTEENSVTPVDYGNESEFGASRLTIESVNGGLDVLVDADAVALYGYIEKVVIHDDVTVASNLLTKGQADLAQAQKFLRTIALSALDLHKINVAISAFRYGAYTHVESPLHGYSENLLTRAMDIDLLDATSGTITLGDEKYTLSTVTSKAANVQNSIRDRVENIFNMTNINKGAIGNIININIPELYDSLTSEIQQSADGIIQYVGENLYLKGEVDSLIESLSTVFEQTSDSFTFQFNQFSQALQDVFDVTTAEFDNQSKYIRFVDGVIYIGIESDPFEVAIANDRISFTENDNEVAYISNSNMYIDMVNIITSMTIGNYAFLPRDNGNLSIKKR